MLRGCSQPHTNTTDKNAADEREEVNRADGDIVRLRKIVSIPRHHVETRNRRHRIFITVVVS